MLFFYLLTLLRMICNVNYVKKIAMPLPESTETRRNLRHSERSERGGKVPEGLRVIQVGIRSRSLSEGTSPEAAKRMRRKSS
jgi:hypothetical protein